ncbi:creatininase family protein [Candidatus Dojkabacteria bacterium]|nr:creatininase family protein [Candidatus Dojkabacteria bacterium]
MLKIKDLSYDEIDKLDKTKTVVLVTVGPIEVHGTHLPIGNDILWAESLRDFAINFLERHSLIPLVYPTIPIGAQTLWTEKGFGIGKYTLFKILKSVINQLNTLGFNRIILFNVHGGPDHIIAIKKAKKVAQKLGITIFSTLEVIVKMGLMESKFNGVDLREDLHAGYMETSIGMYKYPQKVTSVNNNKQISRINPLNNLILKLLLPIRYYLDKIRGIPYDYKIYKVLGKFCVSKPKPLYTGFPYMANPKDGKILTQRIEKYIGDEISKRFLTPTVPI